MRRLLAAGALACALLGLAPESRAASYTSFWALGDSLSDDGNLYAATGGQAPPPPYFEGRFSNGPVWAEHVAADFAAKGLATGNFAYGGAAVEPLANGPFPSPPVVNLGGQIDAFKAASAGKLGKRPVASLWFGANDLLFNGVPTGTAREVGKKAANGVAAGARALSKLGVKDVVLFNLPSLDKTPLFALGGNPLAAEQARLGSAAFNATLARRTEGLARKGINVISVDMYALFNELLADPAKFGVANAKFPCLVPPSAAGPGSYCGDEAAKLLAFFDPVHPNATIHGAIAGQVRGQGVAPVPLPAPALLLLLGMAGLGAVRLRGRQGSRIA